MMPTIGIDVNSRSMGTSGCAEKQATTTPSMGLLSAASSMMRSTQGRQAAADVTDVTVEVIDRGASCGAVMQRKRTSGCSSAATVSR